jgi:Fe2+ or Zn2+ uptake regulation protein
MKDNLTHPTADEIYEQARKIDAHISRGTVYRNLGNLSAQGEILKISVPNGCDHYDSQLHEHFHFCCSKCGKMYDVPQAITVESEKVSSAMSKDGFKVNSYNLIFSGLCPECNDN